MSNTKTSHNIKQQVKIYKFTKIKNNNINIQKNVLRDITNLSTIVDLLRWTVSQFNNSTIVYGHGTDNAWDEALNLILPTLNLPINVPPEIYQSHLTQKEKIRLVKKIIQRIKTRIPVPYLTNQSWFCKLKFYIDRRVFIPRSPIGEIINNNFCNLLPHQPSHVLDLCTGSGCIAIAIATVYPKIKVDAVDISKKALQIAEINIQIHNMQKRVIPIYSNLFNDIPKIKYDLIITNPPYVKRNEINYLPKEFRIEPLLSLTGGCDGLQIIRRILTDSSKYLNKNGVLICEVGKNKEQLKKLYPHIPFYWIPLKNGGEGVFLLTKKQLNNHNIE
ncbi:50S ribosomal protein L3 N(5)-glutamine methyltransferase [Blochmannia endosymbiont of Camponotus (Colobopsis) obliquus]|uniref:50S ribosomal protein L3 N(5)-glutamine methyltransferase n=1 Tax=Blochmannia endosymbiont of Camponotus (Colobopsis) obliquus TaxID=1505597 RepID=UPI00061A7C20|nr:50S ribosomal protein L3 N(5)-glutamine methyltransferase [Blochmannia endosymbiont of Camponotus (Colobopsis) obliquus]AKC60650.1 50S ribosomal protein L3 glutamine methyltransferase [Blochmannia endosymbiont of Camponotus (Colobopsis) obliquus]